MTTLTREEVAHTLVKLFSQGMYVWHHGISYWPLDISVIQFCSFFYFFAYQFDYFVK